MTVKIERISGWLCLSVLLGLVFVLSFHKVYNYDIWWHLKTGETIVQTQQIPRTNTFSYTNPNYHWMNVYWLFQVLVYSVHKVSGPVGLVVMKTLVWLVIGTVLLFASGTHKLNRLWYAAPLWVLGFFAASNRMMVRPEIFTFLFLAIFMVILRKETRTHTRLIWLLPVLQVLWVNIHSLFFLGPIVVAIFAISDLTCHCEPEGRSNPVPVKRLPRRFAPRNDISEAISSHRAKWLILVLLVSAACLVNPWGWRVFLLPARLLTRITTAGSAFYETVSEFQKTTTLQGLRPDVLAWQVLAITTAGVLLVFWRRLRLSLVVVFTIFLVLSCMAVRNIALFGLVAPIVVLWTIPEKIKGRWLPKLRKLILAFSLSVLVLIVLLSIFVSSGKYYRRFQIGKEFGAGLSEKNFYPARAVKYVKQITPEGCIFNDMGIGGYLIYHFWPEKRVFLDGRLESYPDDFYLYTQRTLIDWPEFQNVVRKYGIECAILTHALPATEKLTKKLHANADWLTAYYDDRSVVFLKDSPRNRDVVSRTPDTFVPQTSAEFAGCARFYQVIGNAATAEEYYWKAVNLDRNNAVASNNLANLLIARGAPELALPLLKKATEIIPESAEVLNNLGIAYYDTGNLLYARYACEKARKRLRTNPVIYFNLGLTYESLGKHRRALKCYRRAVALDPAYEKAHKHLLSAMANQSLEFTGGIR